MGWKNRTWLNKTDCYQKQTERGASYLHLFFVMNSIDVAKNDFSKITFIS